MVSRQYVCGCVASYETGSAWFWSKMDKPKSNLQVWLDHSAKWSIFKNKTINKPKPHQRCIFIFYDSRMMFQNVHLKIAFSIGSIITHSTFIRFFSGMNHLMPFQITRWPEGFGTNSTCPPSIRQKQAHLQNTRDQQLKQSLLYLLNKERDNEIMSMSPLNVTLKIGFSIRSVVTHSTLERFFSCMNHLMPSQLAWFPEEFWTHRTCPPPICLYHVHLQNIWDQNT